MAQLREIAAQFRAMDESKVTGILWAELAKAARPFAPLVRARILNIPSAGGVPYHQPPGLRARIARCVVTWAEVHGPVVDIGIEMNSARMPSGQRSLPLMEEGVKRWRHPLFGDRDRWYGQESHEYFYSTVGELGPASKRAVERAVERIANDLGG